MLVRVQRVFCSFTVQLMQLRERERETGDGAAPLAQLFLSCPSAHGFTKTLI